MNKGQKELLNKCVNVGWNGKMPLFKGIFIIQQRQLHDSGYRLMYVIGHTDYDEKLKDFHYYLISSCSDVIDFQPPFEKYLHRENAMCDIHVDIDKSGIIHIWNRSDKHFKCTCPYVSSCTLELVD